MKNIKHTVLSSFVILFTLSGCSRDDDEFYNSFYTNIQGLVTLETQDSYEINDVLWINTDNFSRFLNEPGQSTLLDVYTTSKAQRFKFTFYLEKQIGNNWELINIGNNFVSELGTVNEIFGVTAYAIYNQADEKYEFRTGIRLTESGNYRLSFPSGYNYTNFDMISENPAESTYLTIATTFSNLNGNEYTFTVN